MFFSKLQAPSSNNNNNNNNLSFALHSRPKANKLIYGRPAEPQPPVDLGPVGANRRPDERDGRLVDWAQRRRAQVAIGGRQ